MCIRDSISVQGENIYNTIGFLNRLWAYGAELFDSADRLVINSPNALAALKNYMKSFQFSNPDRNINSWDAAVAEYCKGDTAMAVFYDSHAMRINDYTRSKVAGNIGSMLIPGGVSVLGGWSLGLAVYTRQVLYNPTLIASTSILTLFLIKALN